MKAMEKYKTTPCTVEELWEVALNLIKVPNETSDEKDLRQAVYEHVYKKCLDIAGNVEEQQKLDGIIKNSISIKKRELKNKNHSGGMVLNGKGARARRNIAKIYKELNEINNNDYSDEEKEDKRLEILAKYNMSETDLSEYQRFASKKNVASLEEPLGGNQDGENSKTLYDLLPIEKEITLEQVKIEYRRAKMALMKALKPNEAELFEKMIINNQMSQTEYAEYKGCTKPNIKQLYDKVEAKISQLPEGKRWAIQSIELKRAMSVNSED